MPVALSPRPWAGQITPLMAMPGEAGADICIAVGRPIVIARKHAGSRGIIPIAAAYHDAAVLTVARYPSPCDDRYMARYDHLIIFQKSFALVKKIYLYVNRFPKAQKYVLGARLEQAAIEVVMLAVTINNTQVAARGPLFDALILTIEKLRILLRLAHELSFLSTKGYEILSADVVELGKMASGWAKAPATQ